MYISIRMNLLDVDKNYIQNNIPFYIIDINKTLIQNFNDYKAKSK